MPIALIGAGIAAAGGIASAAIGSSGAKDAAAIQAQAANNSLDFQKQQFDWQKQQASTLQQNFQPFIQAGQGATSTLSRLTGGNGTPADYSSFSNSPDYKFALDQGNRGVTNYENSQGMGLSGGALKDISQFNQGLATQQYGNYYSRLMQLAQLGSSSAGAAGSTGTGMSNVIGNSTNAIGNTIQGVGQAQASGVVGSTNAITGGINSATNNSLFAAYMGKNSSGYGGNNLGNMIFGGGSPTGYGTG